MSIRAISWVFAQEIKPSAMKFVLVALADNAGDTGEAWPAVSTIAKKTGQDRKTVIAALNQLVTLGQIEDTGRRMGATNQIKVYRLKWANEQTVPDAEQFHKSQRKTPVNGIRNHHPESSIDLLGEEIKTKKKSLVLNDEEFIKELGTLFPHLDIQAEIRNMKAWLLTPRGAGRKLTRNFMQRWLSRQDKPLGNSVSTSIRAESPRKMSSISDQRARQRAKV